MQGIKNNAKHHFETNKYHGTTTGTHPTHNTVGHSSVNESNALHDGIHSGNTPVNVTGNTNQTGYTETNPLEHSKVHGHTSGQGHLHNTNNNHISTTTHPETYGHSGLHSGSHTGTNPNYSTGNGYNGHFNQSNTTTTAGNVHAPNPTHDGYSGHNGMHHGSHVGGNKYDSTVNPVGTNTNTPTIQSHGTTGVHNASAFDATHLPAGEKPSKIGGTFDKMKGNVKETIGKTFNQPKMALDGQQDKVTGEARIEAAKAQKNTH